MTPRPFVYLLALIFGFLLLLAPSLVLWPQELALRVLVPPAAAATETARASRSFIDLIRSIRSLRSENERLAAENQRLAAEIGRLSGVEHENELLRSELGFVQAEKDRFSLTLARVVGRAPSTSLQSIIINQGENAGIEVGQAVVSEGFLIGRVAEVSSFSAQVVLITASHSLVPIVLTESRGTGLLRGGLAGLTGEEFSSEVSIIPGEGVVTSPLGEIVPGDIAVGNIQTKLSSDSDITQRIQIHSPVQFSKLETVIVLRPR